jgi:hypothetical protein
MRLNSPLSLELLYQYAFLFCTEASRVCSLDSEFNILPSLVEEVNKMFNRMDEKQIEGEI